MFRDNHKGHTAAHIGISILAAAAGAAATYYLFGSEAGSEKREKAVGWVKEKAHKVMAVSGELGTVSKDMYGDMGSILSEHYDKLKHMNKEELADLAEKVKDKWEEVREEIEQIIKKA